MNLRLRPRGLIYALDVYIRELNTSYAVKSTSHVTLRYLYSMYGVETIDNYLARYWELKYRKTT